ncbi:hypothetical protein DRN67_02205, partial [Candidatus Micrarchaeota archaeon]
LASAAATQLSLEWALAMAGTSLLVIGLSSYLLLLLARRALPLFSRIEVKKLNSLVLAYLICLIYLLGGAPSLLIAAVASAIGVLPPILGVRRTHVMGFILLPSIVRLLVQ